MGGNRCPPIRNYGNCVLNDIAKLNSWPIVSDLWNTKIIYGQHHFQKIYQIAFELSWVIPVIYGDSSIRGRLYQPLFRWLCFIWICNSEQMRRDCHKVGIQLLQAFNKIDWEIEENEEKVDELKSDNDSDFIDQKFNFPSFRQLKVLVDVSLRAYGRSKELIGTWIDRFHKTGKRNLLFNNNWMHNDGFFEVLYFSSSIIMNCIKILLLLNIKC